MADSIAFSPLQVGAARLGHRIVLSPCSRMRAEDDHTPSPVMVDYYAQRASFPGTMLITEASVVAPAALAYANAPGAFNQEQMDGWKKVVDAVHAKKSTLWLQLWAPGRAADPAVLSTAEGGPYDVVGPSAVPMAEGGAVPRELSEAEIGEYARWFAEAARRFVEDAGGDGVEIHGANGYLPDQFLQTTSNQRTDRYGGSVENRCRFALELTKVVVDAVGPSRVGFRASPWSSFQGMKMSQPDTIATFSHLATALRAAHPDLAYLHLIEPRANNSDDVRPGEGESLDFLARIWAPKALLVAGGQEPTLEGAERSVAKYENSAVAYGRYFLSNPDLVGRIKHGVEARGYDRSTFYVAGADKVEGYALPTFLSATVPALPTDATLTLPGLHPEHIEALLAHLPPPSTSTSSTPS